jgi:hypothetical protein
MLQLNAAQLIARTVLARIDAAMSDLTLLEWADEDAFGPACQQAFKMGFAHRQGQGFCKILVEADAHCPFSSLVIGRFEIDRRGLVADLVAAAFSFCFDGVASRTNEQRRNNRLSALDPRLRR